MCTDMRRKPRDEEDPLNPLNNAGKHPRDMGEDDRRDAMSALARKRWEKRDRMRAAANVDASHDASIDAKQAEGGAAQSGMAAPLTGARATTTVDLAVIQALERKAQSGDVAAARELREWRRCDPAEGFSADVLELAQIIADFSQEGRDAMRAWLMEW